MKHLNTFNESNSKSNSDSKSNIDLNNTLIEAPLSDDWIGIYHNSNLLYEGHSIRWDLVIEKLIKEEVNLSGYKHMRLNYYFQDKYTDFIDIDNLYNLPSNLQDLLGILESKEYTYKLS